MPQSIGRIISPSVRLIRPPMPEQTKIFLDKRKLSTRYVPPKLPHRDRQLQELDNFFRDSLADPFKDFLKALQIIGPAGSGKTIQLFL